MFLNNINFLSNRAVIIYALQGDGAKYISTLLSLSPSALLMSSTKKITTDGQYQLDFNLSAVEKQQQVEDLLETARLTGVWEDFRISTTVCFGNINKIYNSGFIEETTLLPFTKLTADIVNSNKHFFMCIHEPNVLKRMLEVWPNAKVIVVTHSPEFIYRYRKNTVVYNEEYGMLLHSLRNLKWELIAGVEYQKIPPSSEEELIKHKDLIINDFGEEFFNKTLEKFNYADKIEQAVNRYFNNLAADNKLCFINGNALLDSDNLISEIKKVYKFLELTNVDFNIIHKLHSMWLDVINKVQYHY